MSYVQRIADNIDERLGVPGQRLKKEFVVMVTFV
jgi:hypothetical protein